MAFQGGKGVMLTRGHDVGYIVGTNIPEIPVRTNKSTVYRETHNIQGRSDSFINRSYLSFSFGGKNIEDFELIVTSQGPQSKQIMGNFRDLTSSYEVIDGQYYWGTYFDNAEITLTLSTDSMTQEHLDSFINWFKPGEEKELIFAEHPNRAIMARVMTAPTMSMIPFTQEAEIIINEVVYTTTTSLYKGDITLSFIMDSPFWYAKSNLLAINNDAVVTQWINANGEAINDYSEDMLKIILEDRVVTKEAMPNSDVVVFGDRFIHASQNSIKIIDENLLNIKENDNLENLFNFHSGITLGNGDYAYIFYGGTAPTKPIIRFTFPIETNNNKTIVIPDNNYNAIKVEGNHIQSLYISMPHVFTSYNKAHAVIDEADSYKNLRELLNDKVTHYHTLCWALRIVDYLEYIKVEWNVTTQTRMHNLMYNFIYNVGNNTYILNGESNHAYGKLKYRKIISDTLPLTDSDWTTYGEINDSIEDISDIYCSEYIKLDERNSLDQYGRVSVWTDSSRTNGYRVSHDFNNGVTDLAILFRHMYY